MNARIDETGAAGERRGGAMAGRSVRETLTTLAQLVVVVGVTVTIAALLDNHQSRRTDDIKEQMSVLIGEQAALREGQAAIRETLAVIRETLARIEAGQDAANTASAETNARVGALEAELAETGKTVARLDGAFTALTGLRSPSAPEAPPEAGADAAAD